MVTPADIDGEDSGMDLNPGRTPIFHKPSIEGQWIDVNYFNHSAMEAPVDILIQSQHCADLYILPGNASWSFD